MIKRKDYYDTAIQIVGSDKITTIREFLDNDPNDGFRMDLHIPTGLIEDAFVYAPTDAASGLKLMMMELLMNSLDGYLREHRPDHYSERDLKTQLDKVTIAYDGVIQKDLG